MIKFYIRTLSVIVGICVILSALDVFGRGSVMKAKSIDQFLDVDERPFEFTGKLIFQFVAGVALVLGGLFIPINYLDSSSTKTKSND